MVGKAILDGQVLPSALVLPFYKLIVGAPIILRDLQSVDTQLHDSLRIMLR